MLDNIYNSVPEALESLTNSLKEQVRDTLISIFFTVLRRAEIMINTFSITVLSGALRRKRQDLSNISDSLSTDLPNFSIRFLKSIPKSNSFRFSLIMRIGTARL